MSGPLYLGCMSSDDLIEDFYIDARSSPDISPETQCRLNCHGIGKRLALIKNSVSCACLDKVDYSLLTFAPCDGHWETFHITHLTESHGYKLVLEAKPQSKNSYTKPGEDILFTASLGLNDVDVIYRFDFDDGVTVITTSPQVSHSWMLDGSHHVNVTARLGIVTITGDLQVKIEDIDEGQPPDVVGLTVGHDDIESLTARSSVKVFDDHRVQCSLSYGDGSVVETHTVDVFGGDISTAHNYSTCGLYEVQAICSNTYGSTNSSASFYARELIPKYATLSSGDVFNISTFGNDIFIKTLTVKLRNTAIGFAMEERSFVSVDTDRLVAGADNLVTLFSNSLTLDRHVLSVRQPVQRPQITAERTSNAWELTAVFTIQLEVSDHVWMSIDYGNSAPIKVLYLPAIEREIQLRDSAIYPSLGDYRMRVRLENEMSSSENTLDISVEVPLVSLSVATYNITSLQEEASFTLDVNMGSFAPQKVVFTIDFDDGNTTQMFYRNPSENRFEPITVRYRYATWGIYRVQVTASNNISQVRENVLVHVGDNITFIDILTETERVAVGGAIEFWVNCPTGSDVEYLLNFGDGTNFTVGELSGPEDSKHSNATVITETFIRVSHVFHKPGSYNTRVTVKNTFGSMSADLCPTLSVSDAASTSSCPDPEVTFREMSTSATNPLVRKRSVDTLITVDTKFDCSQNGSTTKKLTYSWKGVRLDRINEADTSNATLSDYGERTISEYCTFKSLDNTLTVRALDLPFGLYRLTVTVSPAGSDLVYTTEHLYIRVIQSEPVAVMEGENFRTIMRYATAIFDISGSYDPDLEENVRLDLSYHLVFMPETSLKKSKELPMEELLGVSDFISERTIFPSSTRNRFAMYQYGSCFNGSGDSLTDLQAYNGKIKFHADSFSTEHYSFGVVLWVERNGLSSLASQIAEVRSTNVSLDDLGSLLDLAMNADPDTAIRLCGGAASAILNQEVNHELSSVIVEVVVLMTCIISKH